MRSKLRNFFCTLLSSSVADAAGPQADCIMALQQQLADCRAFIAEQQKRMDSLLAELRTAGSTPASAWERINTSLLEEKEHEFDAFYMAFEDKFRGSPAEIKKRLGVYLPVIDRAKALSTNGHFLDIGCGRGEWLELLGDHGCKGVGVDTNRVALARCRELGLEVVESDALEYLLGQGTASYAAVTGFHLVEHLPFEVLMNVVREVFRILQPGGAMILETPDPDNVMVGSCKFYFDPTHRNPIPSETLSFIAEYCGFVNPQILKLHKMAEPSATGNAHLEEMLRLFFTSQDYSVIGFKPQ